MMRMVCSPVVITLSSGGPVVTLTTRSKSNAAPVPIFENSKQKSHLWTWNDCFRRIARLNFDQCLEFMVEIKIKVRPRKFVESRSLTNAKCVSQLAQHTYFPSWWRYFLKKIPMVANFYSVGPFSRFLENCIGVNHCVQLWSWK